MIGQNVLHYRILEKLGEGGMGIVYKAEDTKLDRVVALKFLPTHLSASDADRARFIHEAKAASALNHPNVCTIYDIMDEDGQQFIVMEHVEGQELRQIIGAQPMPVAKMLNIVIQIAEGLSAAHGRGVVHGDINSANIMVTTEGRVKIMDFGLAQLSNITEDLTRRGPQAGVEPRRVQVEDPGDSVHGRRVLAGDGDEPSLRRRGAGRSP